jgi:hypothetical protein
MVLGVRRLSAQIQNHSECLPNGECKHRRAVHRQKASGSLPNGKKLNCHPLSLYKHADMRLRLLAVHEFYKEIQA